MNILIMRAFVKMRKFFANNGNIFRRLDNIEKKQIESDEKFERIFNAIESKEVQPKQGIFFDGQIFDAYRFVNDLIRSAKKLIILIDNYIDDSVLSMFSERNKNVSVHILTKAISKKFPASNTTFCGTSRIGCIQLAFLIWHLTLKKLQFSVNGHNHYFLAIHTQLY